MKILLAKRRALGDTVLLSATVDLLTKHGHEVYALVPGPFVDVLEGHPGIKKIFSYEQGFFSLVRQLRALKLDYFFRLHAPPHKTFLAKFSGAKKVIFDLHTKKTKNKFGQHPNALEWDALLLRSELGEVIPAQAGNPKIYFSSQELEAGKIFWETYGVNSSQIFLLGLGASRITKRWPPKYFARLAELIRDRLNLIPAIITGPGEVEERFAGQVVDEMRVLGMRPKQGSGKGDFIHVAGLPLRKMAYVSSAVKFYVGNDSGPKHICLASGVPTFTFFGPEDPVEWHPYDLKKHPVFFEKGLTCRKEDDGRWCGIEVCNIERHRCMEDLKPEEAAITIQKYFEGANA